MHAESFYNDNIRQFTQKEKGVKRTMVYVGLARLIAFLGILFSIFYLYNINTIVSVVSIVLSLILFGVLIKWHMRLEREKKYVQNLIQINEKELSALKHDFSAFEDGTRFIDPDHFNSYDLDIFGRGSLFQYINRTTSKTGENSLAEMLKNPLLNKNKIEVRQSLVDELNQKPTWRQKFAAIGMLHSSEETGSSLSTVWSEWMPAMKLKPWHPYLTILLQVLAVTTLLLWIFAGLKGLFVISCTIQVLWWVSERKAIAEAYSRFGKQAKLLGNAVSLFQCIENESWQSDGGKQLSHILLENGSPSKEIEKLRKIIGAFDNRINMLVGIILNLMFVWDIQCSIKLIKWHNRNKRNYVTWFSVLDQFEAINSLANLGFNNPEFSYPEITTGEFQVTATCLGHPIIPTEKRICNDLQFNGDGKVEIITGANMAGKSTFLRTIGVNMVLGMAGAPVCAKSMKLTPVEVFSNMRTTDSLFDDESYFFAELKRIKHILDELEKGRNILIILDEILKGTNSVDKLNGSIRLIKKLIAKQARVIIATHDLKLTELEQEFPDHIQNKCFDIVIENNEMQFDYKLKDGVTKVMNATFLMEKMGIVGSE